MGNLDNILDLNLDRSAQLRLEDAQPRLGVLPPAIQRNREIQAILADPFIYSRLGASEMVESIQKTENGYLITTQNFTVSVEVVYVREGRKIGPAEFRLEFSEPVPRN